jgi:hypothetical protein
MSQEINGNEISNNDSRASQSTIQYHPVIIGLLPILTLTADRLISPGH